ncbi:hypothetical protein [Pseudocolwellia sp. HL-MZ7]|uniref:hypothetical protein n=1 Tax=Pseudocolwellia sp. HL-MZ7 TaxID=3400627 RepID=UPI003CF0928F
MKKHKSSNPSELKTYPQIICPKDVNETEDGYLCALELPLFITTSEQGQVINKARAIEKSRTETYSNKAL